MDIRKIIREELEGWEWTEGVPCLWVGFTMTNIAGLNFTYAGIDGNIEVPDTIDDKRKIGGQLFLKKWWNDGYKRFSLIVEEIVTNSIGLDVAKVRLLEPDGTSTEMTYWVMVSDILDKLNNGDGEIIEQK